MVSSLLGGAVYTAQGSCRQIRIGFNSKLKIGMMDGIVFGYACHGQQLCSLTMGSMAKDSDGKVRVGGAGLGFRV